MTAILNASTTSGVVITSDNSGNIVIQSNGSNVIATAGNSAVFSGYVSIPNTFSFKNRLINGAMGIDQRNSGASVTIPAANQYTLDRWQAGADQASKFSVQQTPSATETGYATRVGAGFTNYLACTSLSAYTVGASETFTISQYIEGLNMADLAWGTSSAKTITLSAWVYSSLTGTFGGVLRNNGGSRCYPFTYSIPVANTWTQISVTIAGDTTGTWLTTNGQGVRVLFSLGVGSTLSGAAGAWSGTSYYSATGATSVVGTNGATLYITGVQFEIGSQATSFDFRPYGTEFNLCQRYYQVFGGSVGVYLGNGLMRDANNSDTYLKAWQVMRAQPTVTGTSTSSAFGIFTNGDTGGTFNGTVYGNQNQGALIRIAAASSLTSGQATIVSNTVGAYIAFSAEL